MAKQPQTDVKVDELQVAFPEVFAGATAWAHSDEPSYPGGIVCVSEAGLRSLLRLVKDAGDYMLCELIKHTVADHGHAERQEKMFPELLNGLSRIWCEGDLVVSGLFVAGEPLLNPCVEDDPPAKE